ncbi:MAG: universal stress protein [Pseudomonadota bacterium]
MLPVRGDGKGDAVFAHAAAIAKAFGARVRVVHCHPKPDDLMPFGAVIPAVMRSQIEGAAAGNVDLTRKQLMDEFHLQAKEQGLFVQDPEPGKPTTRFIEYEGKPADAVQRYGRLSDLICVPKPDAKLNLGANTLKSALYSSGRPVMMCPDERNVDAQFLDHVTVGWNGSLEATRAVAMTLPLLNNASRVTILSTGDMATEQQPGAIHLQRYLELRGICSDVHLFKPAGKKVGGQLLEETRKVGAGLMVIGAFHDSYERETLFGGNSQAVVADADFPVVMVH